MRETINCYKCGEGIKLPKVSAVDDIKPYDERKFMFDEIKVTCEKCGQKIELAICKEL